MKRVIAVLILIVAEMGLVALPAETGADTIPVNGLTNESAAALSELALGCIHREYPNKPSHVVTSDEDVKNPGTLHPAFYGCFDWHSAVHGHWMLVRILKTFPDLATGDIIRSALDRNLTEENIAAEAAYFMDPIRKSFERTYGWAWLLKLGEELLTWDDPDGKRWYANLEPLVDALSARYIDFLPRQTYPIRTGVHPNTAFGIAFALDFARAADKRELENVLLERSRFYYADDQDYPAGWEPGGEDFFSPALMEADLMRRVLTRDEFAGWFQRFLPTIPDALLNPAVVADRTDPKIVHLDGLNLSRAWCMSGIAGALPDTDPARDILYDAARRHASEALANITSGNYEGEHWLASFAVYTLSAFEQK
jgi:hypothetical protein